MKRQHPTRSQHGHHKLQGNWNQSKKQKSVHFEENKEESGEEEVKEDEIDSDDDNETSKKSKKNERPKMHRVQEGEEDERPDMPDYAEEGVRMMAFNLKEDREDGHFDESGNFVWAREEKVMQEDAWLENVSAQDMEIAEQAIILRGRSNVDEEETWTERRATSVFMEILNDGETVLKALKRLGKKKKGSKGPEQTEEMKQEFNELTEASDYLMRQGKTEVYHTVKEDLVPQAPPPAPVLWEYKSPDGQIQGPYPSSSFVDWQAQGYFKGDSAVLMRRYNPEAKVAEKVTSAATELEADFDDDDDDEHWILSDKIDFKLAR